VNRRQFGTVLLSSLVISNALPARAASAYVDLVRVRKKKRRVELFGDGKVLRKYDMKLGFEPVGHKAFQGDGKTPEGRYRIENRNPFSRFHLSLKIDYPNARDVAYARSQGKSPGGDIFIHGQPNGFKGTLKTDWTQGCIALSNEDMDELWRFIPVGCEIEILP
jgi:murein L,D-transpeptidase YafK